MTFQWALLAAVTSLLALAAFIDKQGLRSLSPTLSPKERRAAVRAHRAKWAHQRNTSTVGYLGGAEFGGSFDGGSFDCGSWGDGGGAGGCSDGGGAGGGSC